MNKIFTKIASISAGLSLAIGVGIAVGAGQRSAVKVSAAEQKFYTLDGTITGGSSQYATESDITQGSYSWKITGNTTQNPWRIGGNSLTGVDRPIYSTTPINETVSKISLTLGAGSSITLNSFSLTIASDSNFANVIETQTVAPSCNGTTDYTPSAGKTWQNAYYKLVFNVTVSSTSNKFIQLSSVAFFKESANPRGTIELQNLDVINFSGNSDSLSYTWTPAKGSSATISSHAWTSSDTNVATISGDTIQFVAPGPFKVTLNATDSIGEEYEVASKQLYVSEEYGFEIGDTVALYSGAVSMEMTSINKDGSTHYGVGTTYVNAPNGTYLLTVEEGNAAGSLSFVNDANYLSWSSGNSLTTKPTKDDNSSWFVVYDGTYSLIINAASTTREIWWNSTNPRFACYENKTPETSGYNTVDLYKIEEAPVRGTLEIATEFGSTMKATASGQLQYTWTPAEESSATIVSHTWSSSNSDVIAVDSEHNTFSAVAPGKAKISLNAEDSNGQIYSVSTSDIAVIDVVSGSYVKKTSVADGDVVAIVCETAETQMSGIASKIGTYVFYDNAPASVLDFSLIADGDYYAMKTSENKYLNWVSDTDLSFVEETTDNSLWSISFEEGNAVITNKAQDGDAHRYLAWNNNSPRFCAYKTGQTAIQLYGPSSSYEEEVMNFVGQMLDLTCDASGETAPSTEAWANMEDYFTDNVSSEGKLLLKGFEAVDHSTPVTDKEKIEAAMYKYDYIVAKYNKGKGLATEYPDFIERDPDPLMNVVAGPTINVDSNSMIIVVTVVVAISITSIGCLLVIKRRKQQ